MRKLSVFNQITLDGYFCGENGDLSWAKHDDPEWNAYTQKNAAGGGALVLGRVTYELMKSFWPTEEAKHLYPEVAKAMNAMPKFVFSRTLRESDWNNTTLIKGDPVTEMRRLKKESADDMTILGSGTIISQLAAGRLIDEYSIVITPVVLGKGRTMFEGLKAQQELKREELRAFQNGNVVLRYTPE